MSLKLNSYVKSVNVTSSDMKEVIFKMIIWSFGALGLSYILLLGNMVINIVERQGLEAEMRTLTTEVRNLEVAYLSLSNKVDLNLSYSLGFKEAKPVFATRKSLGFAPGAASPDAQVAQNGL